MKRKIYYASNVRESRTLKTRSAGTARKGVIFVDFDFDEWKKLFETDPKEFERKRNEAIEKCITDAAQEHQMPLRQLQWTIDAEIRKCKNPLEACIKLNSMLIEQVYKEGGFLDAVKMLGNPKNKSGSHLKIIK